MLRTIRTPHEDALVLALTIGGHTVQHILVDPRSFVDLLHFPALI